MGEESRLSDRQDFVVARIASRGALVVTTAVVIAVASACTPSEPPSAVENDPLMQQAQDLANTFSQWREISERSDQSIADAQELLPQRLDAISAVARSAQQLRDQVAARDDIGPGTLEGESLQYYATAVEHYAQTITTALKQLKRCVGTNATSTRYENCHSRLERKYEQAVDDARTGIHYALSVLLINTDPGTAETGLVPLP